ncbi:MAG: MCE family protein [Gammaproteobacteria bacterium]|nr:MCE family protein [Gammaproteobacteria bacterium]
MKRDNINYLAVGSFVLAGLVVLLVVLYKLTGRVGDSEPYHAYYGNITGLTDGSRVTYEGYQVGFVDGVEPEQTAEGTRYRVEMRIKHGWRIPTDSIARIYAAGLLAGTVINIEEGKRRDYLQANAEIPGQQGADMFAALSTVASDIGGLTQDTIKPLLENLNRQVTGLGGELGTRVPRILTDVESMVNKLDKSADGLTKMLNASNTQRVGNIIGDVETTAHNFHALSASLQGTQAQLDTLLQDAQGLVGGNQEDLRAAVLGLRNALDSVSREVDGILYDLQGASRNMNEFSRELRGNPGLLLNGHPAEDKGVNGD